jgi:hypothetical protein
MTPWRRSADGSSAARATSASARHVPATTASALAALDGPGSPNPAVHAAAVHAAASASARSCRGADRSRRVRLAGVMTGDPSAATTASVVPSPAPRIGSAARAAARSPRQHLASHACTSLLSTPGPPLLAIDKAVSQARAALNSAAPRSTTGMSRRERPPGTSPVLQEGRTSGGVDGRLQPARQLLSNSRPQWSIQDTSRRSSWRRALTRLGGSEMDSELLPGAARRRQRGSSSSSTTRPGASPSSKAAACASAWRSGPAGVRAAGFGVGGAAARSRFAGCSCSSPAKAGPRIVGRG